MRGQCSSKSDGSSCAVIPSTPGLPLFFFTRRTEASTLLRSTTRIIRSSPPFPERSLSSDAGRDSSLRFPLGASPLPASGQLQLPGFLMPFASETHARFTLLAVRSFASMKNFRGSGVALLGFFVATTTSADFSLRICSRSRVALSGIGRDLPR